METIRSHAPGVPITGMLDIRKPGYFYSNPTAYGYPVARR